MEAYAMNNYYRPASLSIDTQSHNYFEEEEGSILDDNILEQSAMDSGLEMTPPMNGSRRESYAVSSALFSPKTDEWQHLDMQPMASNNPFVDQNSNNPFMRIDAATYGHQNNNWNMGHASGISTPMQKGHDGLPTEFEVNAPVFQRQSQTPFTNPGNTQLPLFSSNKTSIASIPTSPQKDWGVSEMDHRAMPKRMRHGSPTLRSHPEMVRRGDGIRKKNARFDIPVERNLTNIDHLIAISTDETEIKELKQQKRLLRNRQAALDSRQRKKQHTERLEDEKKHFSAVINDLEEELLDMKLAQDEWTRKEQQYEQFISGIQMEKEEMVRAHTMESGDLRKKVSVLTEHIQRLEANAAVVSSVPAPTSFNADYADIDTLTMDGAWDNISFLNDFTEPEVKVENSLVPIKKSENMLLSDPEKPAAQGLLLMLLLVGAFVASKGPSPSIPKLSDDVRTASASLLEDIFKDAGILQSATGVADALAPMPSSSANNWTPSTMNMMTSSSNPAMMPSSLDNLSNTLTQTTEAQNNEQLFSLSAADYNVLTSQDFMRHAPSVPPTSQGRRNLSETLAAMRSNSKKSAAEVYTRSLLWDQVPSEVVRNFARMVEECNSKGGQDECAPVA